MITLAHIFMRKPTSISNQDDIFLVQTPPLDPIRSFLAGPVSEPTDPILETRHANEGKLAIFLRLSQNQGARSPLEPVYLVSDADIRVTSTKITFAGEKKDERPS